MKIIRASTDHAADLGRIHAESWRAAYAGMIPNDYIERFAAAPRRTRAILSNMKAHPQSEYYIAMEKNRPVGFVLLSAPEDKRAAAGQGEIQALYLLSEWTGRGYGKKLMAFALSRLKALSCTTVSLWVLAKNDKARRFYEACGFIFTGQEQTKDFGAPLPVFRYTMSLNNHPNE